MLGELDGVTGGSKVWFSAPGFFSFSCTGWTFPVNLSSSSVSRTHSFSACSKQIADSREGME